MQRNKELARKVARLVVRKVSKDKTALVSTGELISLLSQLYAKSKDFRNFLISPFISKELKLSFLRTLSQKVNTPQSVMDIIEYLIDINGFALLPEIKRLYEHEVEKIMKMSKGQLYLPSQLDKEDIERIVSTVQKILNRELEIDVNYDEKLIGGFILKTAGFVIDASVKRQLERLLVRGG